MINRALPVEKVAVGATVEAAKDDAVYADLAKHAVGPGAGALESGAAAGVAEDRPAGDLKHSAGLRLKLLKLRTKRLILGGKIGALAFKCRVLGLNEPDALLEDRRRAMFVDEFLEKISKRHGFSVSQQKTASL